jgi:hypothetical protein
MTKSKPQDKLIQYRLFELVTTPWKEQKAYKSGVINENGCILTYRHDLSDEQKKAYPSIFYAHAWKLKQLLENSHGKRFSPAGAGRALSALFVIRELFGMDMVSSRKIDEIGMEIFQHYGIDLQPMLEENYDALPLTGSYTIEKWGNVEFNEPNMPIGDIAGFPIYSVKIGEEQVTFTLLEAKKLSKEDGMGVGGGAPANNVGGGNIAGVSPGQEPPGPKGGFKALAKMKKRKIAQMRRDARTLNVVAAEKKDE